ncbi:hypothetical protein EMIHUDRAFT_253234 [Emiliania huxleyi CCMP1516]|uniref:O-methyltransferase domain-containing protein n=2 Tax=Emiliania huxleyi TaxID=2903 RepID=A0A0D3KAY6_EMIH1|nr:hypothetical protein EMIHUDRAFT_253234 [Emiliania huxleyi CCMP1516]EOD32921.1 hypothetical protein EMIHUDRAFT_253234 [Emiliania huxleyi CCMP1516]|eukprot:XP_005785350.1 hypothetical protein EMIHUDRAFT_253234 [Emiliania huxleyi CCMP1516]
MGGRRERRTTGQNHALLAAWLPLLKRGGLYVIEDIHCSLQRGYDLPPGSSETALRVLKRLNATGKFKSKGNVDQTSILRTRD